MDYSEYRELKFRRLEPGILEIVMGEEGRLSVATARMHAEMAKVWLDVDRDPETRVAILRGAGKGFSAPTHFTGPSRTFEIRNGFSVDRSPALTLISQFQKTFALPTSAGSRFEMT